MMKIKRIEIVEREELEQFRLNIEAYLLDYNSKGWELVDIKYQFIYICSRHSSGKIHSALMIFQKSEEKPAKQLFEFET